MVFCFTVHMPHHISVDMKCIKKGASLFQMGSTEKVQELSQELSF